MLGGFDLAERGSYGQFLQAHAAAVSAVEAALDAAGMAALLDDWPERRRAAELAADLAALGLAAPLPLAFPAPAGPAATWGAAYVVEGSRLGGKLLARSVATGLPTAYLAAPQPPGAWRTFLAKLDDALHPEAMHAPAIRSALDVFALFEAGTTQAASR